MRLVASAIVLALALAGGGPGIAAADDIYQWTDPEGRVHFSNRGGSPEDKATAPEASPGGEGWESVLERNPGSSDVQQKAEAAINGLELQMIRKKRDRTRAEEDLKATQGEIVRAVSANPTSLPDLKQREAGQIGELRRIDLEIGVMTANLAKLRALKAAATSSRTP